MTDMMSRAGPSSMNKPFGVAGVSGISQAHRDVTDARYRDLRRPRKVRFYCNGDRYFKGKKLYITPHRYLNFNDMLSDLTQKLPGSVNLPYGVRQIFTPDGTKRIRNTEDLKDGEAYVVAGFENFKQIKYGTEQLEPWSHGKAPHSHDLDGYEAVAGRYGGSQFGGPGRGYYGAFHPSKTLRQSYPMGGRPKVSTFNQRPGGAGASGYWGQNAAPGGTNDGGAAYNKPKVITVVRNGSKPHGNVKILLNRRSVQSFEQLQKDISEAFGPKWKNNKVRKLFTLKGREVQGVNDFFRDDDIFIAIGNESLTTGDVHDILDELYPESPYPKSLMKEWEKTKRRYQPSSTTASQSTPSTHPPQVGTTKRPESSDTEEKIDSGLGSDVSNKDESERDEVIYRGRTENKMAADDTSAVGMQRKKKKQRGRSDSRSGDEDLVSRLEKERVRAADEDRDRARRRMQKKMEAERRALDEERRKKGLIPLKPLTDPFKKLQEEREKEKEEKRDQERKEREAQEKAHRQEEERLQRDREREQRHRRSDASPESKVIVVIKEGNNTNKESGRRSKQNRRDSLDDESRSHRSRSRKDAGYDSDKENDTENISTARKSSIADSMLDNGEEERREQERKERERKERERKIREKEERERLEREEKERKQREQEEKERIQREKEEEAERKKQELDKERKKAEEEQKEKERKEKEKELLLKKKRSKSRIIYKSKQERQVTSADVVLEKYDPGKVMGDGNFAIVKQCRLKDTNHEFAMKIIDKSKLKGKEHMIENEIEIMKLCNQPNIVKLMEEFETQKEIYLIMELVKGGDLFDAITHSVKFGEPESASMVSDLTSALFYLHSRGITHRDLKPENLLVMRNKDNTITLKLADFGLAMEVKEPIFTVCGTPTYVAPEILSEIGYGLEVDMWAVGVITYILLCGFPPFRSPDRNQTELFEFIKAGEYEFLSPYWDNISKAAKDLIARLLIVDRRKRYTAIDVLCHPWVITRGGSTRPSEPMDDYRRNLRRELELQATANRDSYVRSKVKNG